MLMNELVAAFTQHVREAMEIGSNATLSKATHPIRNVLVTGLGGSGIGGSIVAQVTDKALRVPLLVNKDYFLPAFVDQHTLVIVSSYSGNTEETLQAMEAALEKGAKICCVTSGGKIGAIAKEKGLDVVNIPADESTTIPLQAQQPRSETQESFPFRLLRRPRHVTAPAPFPAPDTDSR